jgi:hypothetical protein
MNEDPSSGLLEGRPGQATDLLSPWRARCQIAFARDTGVWLSVERPTPTAQNVLIGHTVEELAVKLAAEYGTPP